MANVDSLILQKGGLELREPGVLPQGSSTQGATDGAMAGASAADIERGYVASGIDPGGSFNDNQQPDTIRPETVGSALDAFVVGAQQATQP